MATSPWYREGTAKFTQGSTTVTGTGTRWVDFVRAGDGIQGPDGKLYQVTNVASNTSMSITPAYGSETTYWTIPIQGYVKRLADAASQLVRDFEGGADEALDAADRAKQSATEASVSEAAALSQASRAESEADRAETEADRAQQAADDAVAVVSGGEASIDPEPGKIPIAGAEGTIKQAWVDSLEFALDKLRVATNKALYGDAPYPVLDFQFQGANMLDPRINFTRASVDWDEYGNEYGIDEPVLTDKGLWVSGARTELLLQTKDLMKAPWRSTGIIRKIEGLTGPMGADVFSVGRETQGNNYLYQNVSITGGESYVASCCVQFKSGDEEYVIHLPPSIFDGGGSARYLRNSDGTLNASLGGEYVSLGGGWYLIWLSKKALTTAFSDAPRIYAYPYDAAVDKPISSPSLKVGVSPTPYTPTEDSQVTVADSAFNSIETDRLRSVIIDLELLRSELDNNTLYILSWGTNRTGGIPNNGVMIWSQSATQIQARVYNNGSFVSQNIPCAWEDLRGLGISISGDRVIFAANGLTAEIQASEDMLSKANFANLYPANTRQSKYRWLKSAAFYDRALTAEQLQELTS